MRFFILHFSQPRFSFLLLAFLSAAALSGCTEPPEAPADPGGNPAPVPATERSGFRGMLTKWYGGRRAAISLTYDHGLRWLSPDEVLIQDIVAEQHIPMDFDFTGRDLDDMPARRRYYLDTLIPRGTGVFGHGYEHINSDEVSEDSARANFRRCYDDMVASGLKPVAYAYPGGDCYRPATRRALAASGFLAGRRFSSTDFDDPYICPDDRLRPADWYALPSLIMFSEKITADPKIVHNTGMLLPFLEGALQRRAWLITTYHEIKDGPGGTYGVDDFRNDIRAIRERDFWIASFNSAVLYLYERERAALNVSTTFAADGTVTGGRILLSDGLPNDYFDHPLTVELRVPPECIGRRALIVREGNPVDSLLLEGAAVLLSLPPDETVHELHLL